jgi:hypothetical protein
MNEPLRPMTLGEILDRTFQIYRAKFWVFAGIAAVPALVMLGINLADVFWLHVHSIISPSPKSATLWNSVIWLAYFHVSAFLGLLISVAHVHVTSRTSSGEKSSIPIAFQFAGARWRSYLWIAVLKFSAGLLVPEILFVVLIFGEAAIAIFAGAFTGNRESAVSSALLMSAFPAIAGRALFAWLGGRLALAIPAAALEELAGIKALRRSWLLSKGSCTRIILTWAVIFFCSWILMTGAQRTLRWIFFYLYRGHLLGSLSQHLYLPTSYLLYAIISVLTGPIYPIALTLFYYDQRIRREGYDIERMMEAAGLNAPLIPPATDGLTASGSEEAQP